MITGAQAAAAPRRHCRGAAPKRIPIPPFEKTEGCNVNPIRRLSLTDWRMSPIPKAILYEFLILLYTC